MTQKTKRKEKKLGNANDHYHCRYLLHDDGQFAHDVNIEVEGKDDNDPHDS